MAENREISREERTYVELYKVYCNLCGERIEINKPCEQLHCPYGKDFWTRYNRTNYKLNEIDFHLLGFEPIRNFSWRDSYPNSHGKNRRFYVVEKNNAYDIWSIPIPLAINLMEQMYEKGEPKEYCQDFKGDRFGKIENRDIKDSLLKKVIMGEFTLPKNYKDPFAKGSVRVIYHNFTKADKLETELHGKYVEKRKILLIDEKTNMITFRTTARSMENYKLKITGLDNDWWIDKAMQDSDPPIAKVFYEKLLKYKK